MFNKHEPLWLPKGSIRALLASALIGATIASAFVHLEIAAGLPLPGKPHSAEQPVQQPAVHAVIGASGCGRGAARDRSGRDRCAADRSGGHRCALSVSLRLRAGIRRCDPAMYAGQTRDRDVAMRVFHVARPDLRRQPAAFLPSGEQDAWLLSLEHPARTSCWCLQKSACSAVPSRLQWRLHC